MTDWQKIRDAFDVRKTPFWQGSTLPACWPEMIDELQSICMAQRHLIESGAIMVECNLKGKWGGCNFEARYDTKPGGMPEKFEGGLVGFDRMLEAMQIKTYVRDVCTRCGRTIERQK